MSSFTLDIRNFVEKAKRNPETVARSVSYKLFSAVIKASPVDTGRFRMNWQTAGAVVPGGIIDAVDQSGNKAVAMAADYVFKSSDWGEFTLTNNLPYAERLEYGWSNQAPQGMVRVNVARFNSLLEEEAAKVK
jgi:hypothetical protein